VTEPLIQWIQLIQPKLEPTRLSTRSPVRLNRRSVLKGAGALSLAYFLAGCQAGRATDLQIRLLQGSIPPQLLQAFQRQIDNLQVGFQSSAQLAELFQLLQTWQYPDQVRPPAIRLPLIGRTPQNRQPAPDLVTIGDFWLAAAIQQQLIQPLPLETMAGWQQLSPAWQRLVRRDRQGQLSETGELWAAPYRWGSLMIAYHRPRFKTLGWTPNDWADLWKPELQGFVSLPESARSVIGLILKKMGQSANVTDLATVPTLPDELRSLHQQVKFYSSDAYLQPLMLEDTWITVGWSTEILPLVERDRRIGAVVPTSGTLLTADLWVRPASAGSPTGASAGALDNSASRPPASSTPTPATQALPQQPHYQPNYQQWIEFCWQTPIANQLSILGSAVSPIVTGVDRSQLPAKLQASPLRLPPAEVLGKSEFLLPLANSDQYRQVWESVRQTG
jgi:putative spermidine/putrescine transport system substrate-binding protein